MFTLQNIFKFLSLLFSGLIAGLLFGYSCSVNIGLKTLSDTEYLKAMQAINLAIQNPYFLVSFISLLIVLPISSYFIYRQQIAASFYFILFATIIYFIGVFGTTMFGNVPLNEKLAVFSISTATINQISAMRQSFENDWNPYHFIRTTASIISFALIIISNIKNQTKP